jgi:hypothetical protein
MRCAFGAHHVVSQSIFQGGVGAGGESRVGRRVFAGQQVRRSRGSRRIPDERSGLSIPHIVLFKQRDEIMIRYNLIGS